MGFSPVQIKIILAIAGFMFAGAAAQHDEESNSKLSEYMASEVKTDHFNGAVLVAEKGKILLAAGYGTSDADRKVPNSPNTKFRVGGIAHQFTAMGILELAQAGKLNVQDYACKYIKGCPTSWQEIKIVNLLTYTSGILDFPDYKNTSMLPTSVPQVLARYQNEPLAFKPGERLKYGNFGYDLLGAVIQNVSQEAYEKYIEERIFKPLGMRDTRYEATGGGLYSTVRDLYRWDRALYEGELVPKESLDQMFVPYREGYGYGWRTLKEFQHRVLINPGGNVGRSAVIRRYADDDVCVIVLSNEENANSEKVSHDLGGAVIGVEIQLPHAPHARN